MSDPYKSIRKQAVATFRFIVSIDGTDQAAFTECTLPVIEWEMEEIKEGGLNTYTHQLPGRRKSARLTLKYGIGEKRLLEWYKTSMDEELKRKKITISLRDSKKSEVASWTLTNALPVKWTGPQLKPDDNTIAIQTLEFVGGEVLVNEG